MAGFWSTDAGRTTRVRVLGRQYRRLFGGPATNPNFAAFARAVARHGAAFLETPRDPRGRVVAAYLLDRAGALVGAVAPGGAVQLRGIDFRVCPRRGWVDLADA